MVGEQIRKLEIRREDIPRLIEERELRREALAGNVKHNLLARYEVTRKQRGGLAVAFVENRICMGCNMEIQPQLYNQIQRNEEVFTCPNCHRILFFPGEPTVHELEL